MTHPDRRRYHPINVTITSPDGRTERNRYSIGSDPGRADAHMVLWLVRLSTSWGDDRVGQYVCGLGVDLPSHIPIGEVGPIVARLNP